MFNDKKTIFALASAPGKAGVAVLRISGPEAFDCLKQLTCEALPESRKAVLRNLNNPETGQLIDQAIILTFPAPNSFTGENIVELHIHGSRAVINILIKLLSNINNFRLASPGEFAKRAFLNGKMDLTAAEGLADLIESETLMQQQQAIRQVQGELANLYNSWKSKLIRSLALIEAYIDFPEDDVPEQVIAEVNQIVISMKDTIYCYLNDNNRGEILRRGIMVAIIGAPNVGKSSLLNYLAQRDVAIVSNIAGTTRDVIEVNLDLAGYPVTIADTAGIRESLDVIEQEGVTRALKKAEDADIKVLMLSSCDENSFDQEIVSLADENTIILMNKIDKQEAIINGAICVSVKENIGLDLFLDKLSQMIDEKFSPANEPVLTRQRHRQFLNLCYEHLCRFDLNNHLELACEDLRLASRALGQIVGIIDVETILDEIFINFCIGK